MRGQDKVESEKSALPMKRVIDLYHRLEKAKSGGDAVLSVVRRLTYT